MHAKDKPQSDINTKQIVIKSVVPGLQLFVTPGNQSNSFDLL